MKERAWTVRLYWKDKRGSFESGADTTFPEDARPMWIIEEVARWRGVDLANCTRIEAASTELDP